MAMRERPSHPFSLQELADIAVMSPFHFVRVFRDIVGVPPRQFLSALRLEAAKHLLLTTALNVIDICYEVGYDSVGTFTTRFTDAVGVPPTSLRQMLKSGALSTIASRFERQLPIYQSTQRDVELTGVINAPETLSGLIFVGLFESPIPQNQPVACDLRTTGGEYHIAAVPDGQYYVMAVAFDKAEDPLTTLLAEKTFRGKNGPVVVANGAISGPTDVTLRESRLTDPPIVVALPLLLAQRRLANERKLKLKRRPFTETTNPERHNSLRHAQPIR
jgi:AraC-like DNA-binding protein